MPKYEPQKKKRFEPKPPGEYRRLQNESKGFGDTVSKFIKKATLGKIKECEPCRKRKEELNKMFPYNTDGRNKK